MDKKYLLFGFVALLLLIGFVFLDYYLKNNFCFDGQGFSVYIPKSVLENNFADISNSSGNWVRAVYKGYIAQTTTNRCGGIDSIIIIENGKEVKVSQKEFDKFIKDYNFQCDNCLIKVSRYGNSPLVAEELLTNNTYFIINIGGMIKLREVK